MAKPFESWIGSSCHIHASLFRDEKPAFADDDVLFDRFLAGQIACVEELAIFFAPTINSYKRFAAGSWAPKTLAWGHDNRTCGFRIVGHGASKRMETRIPGGAAAVTLPDPYGDGEISIELDPAAPISEQIRKRFRRAGKLERSRGALHKRIRAVAGEIDALQGGLSVAREGASPEDAVRTAHDHRVRRPRNLAVVRHLLGDGARIPRRATSLLRELVKVNDVRWIRPFYLYPQQITDELLDLYAGEEKIVKYIDMPLQHINDRMLKAMHRLGNRAAIERVVDRIRHRIPGVTFRTAFIVGFPGETEAAFTELRDYVEQAEFDRVAVFLYSHEEDTPAVGFDKKIDRDVMDERRNELLAVQDPIAAAKGQERVGSVLDVLIDGPSEESNLLLEAAMKGWRLRSTAWRSRQGRWLRLQVLPAAVRVHHRADRRLPCLDPAHRRGRHDCAIWASLGFFNAVTSAVNHAWGVEKRRSFLKHRLVGFLILLSAGGILVVALAIVSAAKVAQSRWFGAFETRAPFMDWLSGFSANQMATLLLVGCVALIFYFIPNTKVRFRDVWPGAIVVGLLWRGALSLFSWYARDLASWNVIHGSVTTVV